jgi:hypothetical protein
MIVFFIAFHALVKAGFMLMFYYLHGTAVTGIGLVISETIAVKEAEAISGTKPNQTVFCLYNVNGRTIPEAFGSGVKLEVTGGPGKQGCD